MNVKFPDITLLSVYGRLIQTQKDWTDERLLFAIQGYKEFLALCKATPDETHEPTADVDEVWHTHILFTEDYADFCADYFGYFLHHKPYLSGAEVTTFGLVTPEVATCGSNPKKTAKATCSNADPTCSNVRPTCSNIRRAATPFVAFA